MLAVSNTIHRIDIEPVVNPVSVNELPQVNEPEEKSDKPESAEKSSFAELLAGLLRNSETNSEVTVIENSFGELDSDELLDAQKFTLLKETPLLEKHFDEKASIEDINVFAEAQKIFPDLETVAAEASEGEFYRELSNLIRSDLAPEADLDGDFFDVNSKNTLIDNDVAKIAAQNAQAVQSAQESLAETNDKKNRTQKTSIVNENNTDAAAVKNERAEEAAVIAEMRLRKENEKPGKMEEVRNTVLRDRPRGDKISFEVKDMRTEQSRSFAAVEASLGRTGGESAVREYTLELRLPEQNNNFNQANTSWEAKAGSALENLLARELHQSFNGDIVRHASMALKDGGEGTIKIALKPESLGNVKIALELSDNKITGKIFVESEEALNAFRKEVASLEQAFKDSGFASADLNLSLASNGQNAEGWEDNQLVPHIFASRYEDNSERIESESAISLVNVFIGHKKSSINVLA